MLLFPADIEGSTELWGAFPNSVAYLIAGLLLTGRFLVALLMLFPVIQIAMNGPNKKTASSHFSPKRSDAWAEERNQFVWRKVDE